VFKKQEPIANVFRLLFKVPIRDQYEAFSFTYRAEYENNKEG